MRARKTPVASRPAVGAGKPLPLPGILRRRLTVGGNVVFANLGVKLPAIHAKLFGSTVPIEVALLQGCYNRLALDVHHNGVQRYAAGHALRHVEMLGAGDRHEAEVLAGDDAAPRE